MKKRGSCKKLGITLLGGIILLVWSILGVNTIDARGNASAVTILFSHDMHDHFLPQNKNVGGEMRTLGGYGRLQTIIDEERAVDPELLLVDAGDFSMGSLFQTIYASDAPQLRIMGEMGYDAITLGNHEFDFRAEGLTSSLIAAVASQETCPPIVAGNIGFDNPNTNQDLESLKKAMDCYGVAPYTIVEKQGVKIGVFGVIGEDAQSNAPMAGVQFTDAIENAKQITKILKEKEQVDLIVCLSHSGTNTKQKYSEDQRLAKEVPDINVIISGHTHTTLETPIIVGDTIIGSCGEYGENLGKIKLVKNSEGDWGLEEYTLIPVDIAVPENDVIVDTIKGYQKLVEKKYLTHFGYKFDQVLGCSTVDFESAALIGKNHEELRLGNFIADGYRYAVRQAEGDAYEPIAMTAVPSGTIRGSLVNGDITVADVFTVSSLGIGQDGTAGYPLVSAYLTGKEIKTVCEVDASISPIMSEAQLYLSGVNFTFNPNRLLFNKVTDCYFMDEEGNKQFIEEDQLYRVVVGWYSAQMLSVVGEKSFGLLSIVPKDKAGIPITDFESVIIKDPRTGGELKEWLALAQYIQSFDQVDGVPQIPSLYSKLESRKIVEDNKQLGQILKQPNKITWMVYGIITIILALVITISVKVGKKVKSKF